MTVQPINRLIRWPEVQSKTGLSYSTIWRSEKAGLFPKRRQLGPNSIAWIESEIDDWINGLKKSKPIFKGRKYMDKTNDSHELNGLRRKVGSLEKQIQESKKTFMVQAAIINNLKLTIHEYEEEFRKMRQSKK